MPLLHTKKTLRYIYVLFDKADIGKSIKDIHVYVGQTNDLKRRFREHKSFHNKTKYNSYLFNWLKQIHDTGDELIMKVIDADYDFADEYYAENTYNLECMWYKFYLNLGYKIINDCEPKRMNVSANARKRAANKMTGIGNHMTGKHHTHKTKQMLKEINTNKAPKRKVYQFDLSGKFIDEHESLHEAVKSIDKINFSGIMLCCQHKALKAHNFVWRYAEEFNNIIPTYKIHLDKPKQQINNSCKNKQQIAEYTNDGKFIRLYEGLKECINETGLKRSSIKNVLLGKNQTLFGKRYKYIGQNVLEKDVPKTLIIEESYGDKWRKDLKEKFKIVEKELLLTQN